MSQEPLEFSSSDMENWANQEVSAVLKSLLRNLTEVRTQRGVPRAGATKVELERQRGEINGLNIAIAAVKRRIR